MHVAALSGARDDAGLQTTGRLVPDHPEGEHSMNKRSLMLMVAASLLLAAANAALADGAPLVTTKPVKVTAEAARGPIFDGKNVVKDTGPDGPTRDVLLARSKDRKVEAGLYDAGPSEQDIDSYPEDEFMYFIEGGVKLTS